MERRWWGGWKVQLAAGLVSVGLVATLLGIALVPRIRSPLATHTSSPLATLTVSPSGVSAAPNLVVPAGWNQVLPGLVVSDFSHFNTLVTSAAKPSRVAACALPPHPWPVMVAPQFVLSDDGGRTWQQYDVPLAGSVWGCDLAGDLLDPDMYTISVTHIFDGRASEPDVNLVTHDAGHTWRLGSAPQSIAPVCAMLPQQLHMPAWVEAQPCAVDPLDPTHLYALITTSATENRGMSLYETYNSGTSWRLLHAWPTAIGSRFMEIHSTIRGLYVVDGQDGGGGEGDYRSTDGGASWHKVPLKAPVSSVTYFGQAGRLLATVLPHLYQVDPLTGAATPLGDVPVTQGMYPGGYPGGVISAVAICEGSQPSLVVSGPLGSYMRSLPPLG
jgi:BNR/Asp-box repeat